MILVTKLNGRKYYIKPDMIEYIDSSPDTLLCLTTGKRLNILEPPEEVVDKIVEYRRRIFSALPELGKPMPRTADGTLALEEPKRS